MNEDKALDVSRGGLLRGAVAALSAALLLLVLVVWPAEFGVDPTGFGRITGLTQLAAGGEPGSVPDAPPVNEAGSDTGFAQGISRPHGSAPATERLEIRLQPLDEVEYKALLEAGEPMLYRWSVRGSEPVYYDFHGEPTEGEFPEDYFQRYGEGESLQAAGSFVPTFTGHHGWYWLNIADREIVIELEVTGYYSELRELYRGNQMDRYKR